MKNGHGTCSRFEKEDGDGMLVDGQMDAASLAEMCYCGCARLAHCAMVRLLWPQF